MQEKPPVFSLIMATIGRTIEIERFLRALEKQTFRDFELIIVDQNSDDRVSTLIRPFRDSFTITHLRSEAGLSRARNVGLKNVRGSIVAFPDDDCWYPPQLLERVNAYISENSAVSGLSGMCKDGDGAPAAARWAEKSDFITRNTIWRQAISFTIFLRRDALDGIEGFDEELGVGANTAWGSGEETDLLLRILARERVLYYDRAVVIHHPSPVVVYDEKALQRAKKYGLGLGRVLKKHGFGVIVLCEHVIRPFLGMLLGFITFRGGRALFYKNVLCGRVQGYFSKSK